MSVFVESAGLEVDAILFDLDDTLIPEQAADHGALVATVHRVSVAHDIQPDALMDAVRGAAEELWCARREYAYCLRLGISSCEGLWCRFAGGPGPESAALRAWAPEFRLTSWDVGLQACGINDPTIAHELAESFFRERRRRHRAFPDAIDALSRLKKSARLGVVTNGASCLQREKLAGAGLTSYFEAIVVSEDIGWGKPDARIFFSALSALDVSAERTLFIGDSGDSDVDGARSCGLAALWLDRSSAPDEPAAGPPKVRSLADI
jgi:putative hydrolase of the HAD superfamily